jgi:cobalt-zinc-cadmium efflux system outer membrane protein
MNPSIIARCALVLFGAVLLSASGAVRAGERLTLDQAFAHVAASHPDLRLVAARTGVLEAERDLAAQKPALAASVELENGFGTGAARALDGAEITLTLSSVLERGGKLDARRTLAQSRIDALAIERETRRLDLLAETARRYLAIVGAEQHAKVAELDIEQRQRAVKAAQLRLQAGASPEAVVLTAQAELARAELSRDRARQEAVAAGQQLAALWGERNPEFTVADVDPLVLPDITSLETMSAMLDSTPELAQFADEKRIREARLQLARTSATPDVNWQIGVRQLRETNDFALVGGFSVPLGSGSRAQPEIRAADAELAALSIEREAKGLSLYSTLAEAHGRYTLAQAEVDRLQHEVLPKLIQAAQATERAYRAGAISYLEWAQLLSEQTTARQQQLDVALDAQHALIEIQRLTGQAFVLPSSAATGVTP